MVMVLAFGFAFMFWAIVTIPGFLKKDFSYTTSKKIGANPNLLALLEQRQLLPFFVEKATKQDEIGPNLLQVRFGFMAKSKAFTYFTSQSKNGKFISAFLQGNHENFQISLAHADNEIAYTLAYESEKAWNAGLMYYQWRQICLGFDVFIDKPISADKNKVLTFYGAYHILNFGPGYIRNIGVMNPATGTNKNGSFNGSGDGFPMLGTGNVLYTQLGYVPNKQMFANGGFLQVYGASQIANYARLADKMLMYEAGLNWFVHGNQSEKISINYQSRPIYNANSDGNLITTDRKGMIQVQFQVSI